VANAGDDGVVGCGATGTVDAVVCGICRSFTYALLDASLQQLLSGAGFIATNPDATYPLEGGRLQPGAGSLVAALKTCAGRAPTVAGKPAPRMVEMALRTLGVRPQRALVVGDRPDTDLAAGQAAGCDAVLVLTGVTRNAPTDQSAIEDLRGLLR
jgi:4-nitrophenyl phosphatase